MPTHKLLLQLASAPCALPFRTRMRVLAPARAVADGCGFIVLAVTKLQ